MKMTLRTAITGPVASFLLASFLCVLASACHITGPRSIKTGRGSYNVVIQQTSNEQLVLNLVRLKYRDAPLFLVVTSISTSFSFEAQAGVGGSIGDEALNNEVGASAGVAYSEKPTVTYAPLQGQQFVTQLMSPIGLDTVFLLYQSGWRIDRIFGVCVQSLGGLKNAPSASSPTPTQAPEYEAFTRVTGILRTLQARGLLDMGYTKVDDRTALVLEIAPEAADFPELQELADALGLPEKRLTLTLTRLRARSQSEYIPIATRSVIASMFLLSHGVEVPTRDEAAGRVTVTLDEKGQRFDWWQVTGDLLKIHSSNERPPDAYAAVAYRGSWFYIHDSDLNSKSTFLLLAQLLALQAGEFESTGPILTLPVGQ
jgi:hypothetical protein